MTIDSRLRVVIAGGGTGGHLYPGIAVAKELASRAPGADVSFIGTARGLESRVVPQEGFPLDLIRSGGLKGKSLQDRARGLMLLPLSVVDAWVALSRRRPHVVIGVGGYSSGPVVLAAAVRAIPTLVLEQNAVPGLTNRLLARLVDAAAVTFESTVSLFPGNAFVAGNPVRSEFFAAATLPDSRSRMEEDSGKHEIRVLIFGGSQGAHAINVAMVEAAPRLAASEEHLRLVHQTGERDVEMVRAGYREAGLQAEVEPFLHDMGRRLAAAHIVVSRAGATSLAELAAAGKPAVLVPLPTATDDHQRKNAEAVEAAGAADVLPQPQMTGAELAARILALAADPDRRERMSRAAKRLARPDAARLIADRAIALGRRTPHPEPGIGSLERGTRNEQGPDAR